MLAEENNVYKRPSADVLQNRCFIKILQYHTKAPVLESEDLQLYQKETPHGYFPVSFAKLL